MFETKIRPKCDAYAKGPLPSQSRLPKRHARGAHETKMQRFFDANETNRDMDETEMKRSIQSLTIALSPTMEGMRRE